ncbi:hypothetical protein D3C75_908780 [compost metagenome]
MALRAFVRPDPAGSSRSILLAGLYPDFAFLRHPEASANLWVCSLEREPCRNAPFPVFAGCGPGNPRHGRCGPLPAEYAAGSVPYGLCADGQKQGAAGAGGYVPPHAAQRHDSGSDHYRSVDRRHTRRQHRGGECICTAGPRQFADYVNRRQGFAVGANACSVYRRFGGWHQFPGRSVVQSN